MDNEWFKASVTYWDTQEASKDGMLGGFSVLHEPDITDSRKFLQKHIPALGERRGRILGSLYPCGSLINEIRGEIDVGAGIGRISEHLLLSFFGQVSILESAAHFVEKARERLGDKLAHAYCCRMQEFVPQAGTQFDCIWIQWVLSYASDEELVEFLSKCKKCLVPGGLIFVKENALLRKKSPDVDPVDHSIIRCDTAFKKLFALAGLGLVDTQVQTNFPPSLYPVVMYCLRPL